MTVQDVDGEQGPADRTGPDPTDEDLPAGDSLLGVPPAAFLQVRALRGLALIVVAAAILLWPAPTDRALGILVGVALGIYAITATVDLVRHRERRDFFTIVGVAVATGFASALILHPDDSLRSVTETCGVIMIAAAALGIVQLARKRRDVSWELSKAVALAVGGGLLLAFPMVLLEAATSIGAGLLAASGLLQVFAPAQGTGGTSDAPGKDLAAWIRRRPELTEDRGTLQEKVYFEGESSPVRFARFAALMGFSAVIASVGVVVESTAVVIGAMLIAPLMVPLMGTALALTMGWPLRARRAGGIALFGVGLAVSLGALIGAVSPRAIDVSANAEILARISPTTLDLAIAVAAGAAGAYALSRRDVSDSLPGVAVAIALVPPLTVVGLSWQQGEWAAGNGALLLFLTNATAILVAGGATFILIGMAPLHRVSESQERLKTVIVALLTVAVGVIVLLALNGAQLTEAELGRSDVDAVIEEWKDAHSDYRVVDIRTLDDRRIVVDLAGPGRPPDLDALVDDLDAAAGDALEVRLTWVEQDQITVGG